MLSPDPDEGLTDHDPSLCLECKANAGPSSDPSPPTTQPKPPPRYSLQGLTSKSGLLNSFGTSFKAKTAEMKGKLIDYIVNPNNGASGGSGDERHVKSSDKEKSKPYRNLGSVFSLGLEDSDESPESKFTLILFTILLLVTSQNGKSITFLCDL